MDTATELAWCMANSQQYGAARSEGDSEDLQAEAEFWRRNEGYRLGPSDQQLGFDCGGQQWVLESCFPTGTLKSAFPISHLDPVLLNINQLCDSASPATAKMSMFFYPRLEITSPKL